LFLESKKCNWLWNGDFGVPKEYKEFNRFDGDYGKYLDFGADKIHPGPKHHEEYAHRLHDFISRNFPEYINGYLKLKKNLI